MIIKGKDYPYINHQVDKKGSKIHRYYFRRKGYPRTALPGIPGSKEFMAAYNLALAGKESEIARDRTVSGSLSELVIAYYRSSSFRQLAPSTQQTYRNIIERFRAEHGSKPINQLERKHILRIRDEKSDTPSAANNLLKIIKILLQFGLERGYVTANPAKDIKNLSIKGDGHHTWTEEEIEAFEAYWKIGTTPRLAFALLLYTGQRSGDVRKMGWKDVDEEGNIYLTQEKTGSSLYIPIHKNLHEILTLIPKDQAVFITTSNGKPFTSAGFGNWFRDQRRKAQLPERCRAHGLRKAAARRFAEAGCSALQIAAITGHKTYKDVERYTRKTDQKKMAQDAMNALMAVHHK